MQYVDLNSVQKSPCLYCGKPFRGRSDKKFCDDGCRSNYNNARKDKTSIMVRKITTILKRNRTILNSIVQEYDMYRIIEKEELFEKGFSFKYLTHTVVIDDILFRCCFDLCYTQTGDSITVLRMAR